MSDSRLPYPNQGAIVKEVLRILFRSSEHKLCSVLVGEIQDNVTAK